MIYRTHGAAQNVGAVAIIPSQYLLKGYRSPYITRFMLAPSMEKYGLVDERISAKNISTQAFVFKPNMSYCALFGGHGKSIEIFSGDKSLRYKNSKVCQSSRELLELSWYAI